MDKLLGAIAKDDVMQALPTGNKAHGGANPVMGDLLSLLDNDDDVKATANDAADRAGDHGSSDMFKAAMGMLSSKKQQVVEEDIDEEDAVKKHKKYFVDDDDDDDDDDEHSLGTAAAMQALKTFSGGQMKASAEPKKSESAFLAMAMSEASVLFDQRAAKGKVASGTAKESAVEKAGEMAMKMYFKSQGQSQGGLMGMASKFM